MRRGLTFDPDLLTTNLNINRDNLVINNQTNHLPRTIYQVWSFWGQSNLDKSVAQGVGDQPSILPLL